MDKQPLTARQKQIYDFICKGARRGLPPTVRETCRHFGIVPNAVNLLIKRIVAKGWLVSAEGRSRSCVPTELSDQIQCRGRIVAGQVFFADPQPVVLMPWFEVNQVPEE